MNPKRVEVFLEFLVFGILVGIVEDILAIKLATGEPITWRIIGIVVGIAIPFALIGEFIVDQVDFVSIIHKWQKKRKRRRRR
jgi:hypothetical protein